MSSTISFFPSYLFAQVSVAIQNSNRFPLILFIHSAKMALERATLLRAKAKALRDQAEQLEADADKLDANGDLEAESRMF